MALAFRNIMSFTLCAVLVGCGSGSPYKAAGGPPAVPANPTAIFSGNWEIFSAPTASGVLPASIVGFLGSIQFNGAVVSATLHFLGPVTIATPTTPANCPNILVDIPFTGSIDSSSNLSLTGPIVGGVATITATLPSNPQTFTPGSFQIAGGTCSLPASAMTIVQFAPVSGTYVGTLNVLDLSTGTFLVGSATTVTAALNQSTIPNADGEFPLSGSITATGACTGTFNFSDGIVYGNALFSHPLSGLRNTMGDLFGAINPNATTLTANLSFFSPCNQQLYQGTLNRQ